MDSLELRKAYDEGYIEGQREIVDEMLESERLNIEDVKILAKVVGHPCSEHPRLIPLDDPELGGSWQDAELRWAAEEVARGAIRQALNRLIFLRHETFVVKSDMHRCRYARDRSQIDPSLPNLVRREFTVPYL